MRNAEVAHKPRLRSPQYWLAELDQYDNPKLIDGSHDSAAGATKAAYIINALQLGPTNRRFAVAKVILSECVSDDKGVNQEAIRTLRSHR